jgi:hypothetical protein
MHSVKLIGIAVLMLAAGVGLAHARGEGSAFPQ